MEEQQNPAPEGEAGDEDVLEAQEAEITEKGGDNDPTTEESENTEGQGDTQPAEDESEDEPSKGTTRAQRRKAHMQRLKDEASAAKSKVGELEARLAKYEQAAQSAQPPKEADFQDYAEYQAALAAHKSMEALDRRQRQEVEDEQRQTQKQIEDLEAQESHEIAESWQDQMAEGAAKYADFEDVALNSRVPINSGMAKMIATSDVGADVAYHLGKNLQEAASIAQMSDLDAARAIGRIEARISAPKPRTKSEAPEPIKPVKPAGKAAVDPENMTSAQWRAWRESGGTL